MLRDFQKESRKIARKQSVVRKGLVLEMFLTGDLAVKEIDLLQVDEVRQRDPNVTCKENQRNFLRGRTGAWSRKETCWKYALPSAFVEATPNFFSCAAQDIDGSSSRTRLQSTLV